MQQVTEQRVLTWFVRLAPADDSTAVRVDTCFKDSAHITRCKPELTSCSLEGASTFQVSSGSRGGLV